MKDIPMKDIPIDDGSDKPLGYASGDRLTRTEIELLERSQAVR